MTTDECPDCGGTTICNNCENDGKPCDECGTTGTCPTCNGTGEIEAVQR